MNIYNRGDRAVLEEEVSVFDSCLYEFLPLIHNFVESDHVSDVEVFKDLQIIFRCVASPFSHVVDGPHEGNEFSRDYPIHISIFDLSIVIVLFRIEVFERVPTKFDSNLQSLETVKNLHYLRLKLLLYIHRNSLRRKRL